MRLPTAGKNYSNFLRSFPNGREPHTKNAGHLGHVRVEGDAGLVMPSRR
jgi:hypothetical protein